jgi:HEPN domain-containing protein
MSQARTGAWWRQAHNDLQLAELASANGFHAQACFTVTSRYPLEDTPPSELFDPADSRQALATATAVVAWVEQLDQPSR